MIQKAAELSVADLAADRSLLARASTAERLASLLRTRITEGTFPPGSRLPEEALGQALGVSRNTLREAFRLLAHERLLVHQLNRGVFVAAPERTGVVDLYRARRVIEVGAVLTPHPFPAALAAVAAATADAQRASAADAWDEVCNADIRFHAAIAALAGSERVDETMRMILAELRLVFCVMTDPEEFHRPYLARNDHIAALLAQGNQQAAAAELTEYLADAEAQLLDAYDRRHPR